MVGQDADGTPAKLETYRLAANEREFWAAAAHPHTMAAEHNERFTEYLKRVLLSTAALAAPQDVAWFLASYARDAKARIGVAGDWCIGHRVEDAFLSGLSLALAVA